MRAFIIPMTDFGYGPEPDEAIAVQLETAVAAMIAEFGLEGRAEWYYDEFVYPTEHGVKVDIKGVDTATFLRVIHDIKDGCMAMCDEVDLEIPGLT